MVSFPSFFALLFHASKLNLLLLTHRLGTKLAAKGEQAAAEAASDEAAMGLMGSASGVGKYLATAAASTTKRKAPEAPVPEVGKKKKSGGGFGDFSGW